MTGARPQRSRRGGALQRSRDKWADLRPRVISGAVLVVLGLALLLSSGLWLRFGVAAVCGVMMWELARLTAGPTALAPAAKPDPEPLNALFRAWLAEATAAS